MGSRQIILDQSVLASKGVFGGGYRIDYQSIAYGFLPLPPVLVRHADTWSAFWGKDMQLNFTPINASYDWQN